MIIGQGGSVRVFVATRPVDFRKGIDGLALAVQEMLGHDPFCGAIFVFRAKRADRIKLLVWDQTGMVLVHKDPGSYYTSFIFSWCFSVALFLRACSGPIIKRIPTAALLFGKIRFGDFV